MGIFDKAKEGLEKATDSEWFKETRGALEGFSEKSLQLVKVETLADLIELAAAKQEKVNAVLAQRNANYRVSDIQIGMGVPPSVSFSIRRLSDGDGNDGPAPPPAPTNPSA